MNVLLMLSVVFGVSITLVAGAVQPLGAGYNSRCVCLKLESRVIPQDNLRRVVILPRGPHCKTTEVIAGLTSGERICLNPRTHWVKKLIMFIEKKKQENNKL
ncbi:C-X-C motif chemokine 19 precursor [Danio rerio]|uniref:C-X-C motif chemokine 19 precursor n=1 Tax=Danio rerio TaxID=7955 RepID=A9ZPF1_DANRE|nr:C-X-C motif chemokine 19 precursor [Danio rerio]BAF98259.1 chemokine CXCL-C13d [Danio rerio]|eukprot:NP_001107123.1 uncharacterized protein LOC100003911 precursor [Danio rerio]